MKCKCGLEMELWQTTLYEGNVIKRWRCACGEEKTDIVYRDKQKAMGGLIPKDFEGILLTTPISKAKGKE